jgi:rhodanese-related sulfurtransferase
MNSIDVSEINSYLDKGALLLDVRTKIENKALALDLPCVPIPLSDLSDSSLLPIEKNQTILLLCQSGQRAQKAYELLQKKGYKNLLVIEGGLKNCCDAGLPIRKNETVHMISLERQVRITAGIFVLIGSLLGLILHTGFFVIPIFIGAGLIFAGVSNWCGMALVLARMPWNKI